MGTCQQHEEKSNDRGQAHCNQHPSKDRLHPIQLSGSVAIADGRLERVAHPEVQHSYDAVHVHDDGEGRNCGDPAIFQQEQIHDDAHDRSGDVDYGRY